MPSTNWIFNMLGIKHGHGLPWRVPGPCSNWVRSGWLVGFSAWRRLWKSHHEMEVWNIRIPAKTMKWKVWRRPSSHHLVISELCVYRLLSHSSQNMPHMTLVFLQNALSSIWKTRRLYVLKCITQVFFIWSEEWREGEGSSSPCMRPDLPPWWRCHHYTLLLRITRRDRCILHSFL